MRIVLATVLALCSWSAIAETITAVCREPTGHTIGNRGDAAKGEAVDVRDGFAGGSISLTWRVGATESTVAVRGAGGGTNTQRATLISGPSSQVSFVIAYPGAVALVSFFPDSATLMFSDHGPFLGFSPRSAIARTFTAKCQVTRG